MGRGFFFIMVLISHISAAEGRIWALSGGEKYKAEFVLVMGDKVVLKNSEGEQVKIQLARFSAEDRLFIELANPPHLEISFRRKSNQKYFSSRFTTTLLPEIQINTFGVRIKQRSAGAYKHELLVEFCAIGKERAGNRFILLDRYESSFTLSTENQCSHECWGRAVELDQYEIFYITRPRGKKYDGHLIVVTDARGEQIAVQGSHDWLLENIENLKRVPIGAYMDKTCTRAFPTRPKACRY
jgi:hypothetical protein